MTSLIYLLGVLLAKEVVASGILPSITAAPVLNVINTATTDIGYYACMTAEAAIGSCSSALGGLDDLPNSRVAQCLCCSGSAWSPEPFDDSAESCAAWIKTGLSKSTTQYSGMVDGGLPHP